MQPVGPSETTLFSITDSLEALRPSVKITSLRECSSPMAWFIFVLLFPQSLTHIPLSSRDHSTGRRKGYHLSGAAHIPQPPLRLSCRLLLEPRVPTTMPRREQPSLNPQPYKSLPFAYYAMVKRGRYLCYVSTPEYQISSIAKTGGLPKYAPPRIDLAI